MKNTGWDGVAAHLETLTLQELRDRRAHIIEVINEDDGPARMFYEARVEYRLINKRIEALTGEKQ